MAQTSYSYTQGIGFAGQIADLSNKRIVTGVNVEGSAIPYGIGVTIGTGGYELPDGSVSGHTDAVFGITVHAHDVDQRTLTGTTDAIPAAATFNLLTEGVVYVAVEAAVNANGLVYCRHTANGAGKLQLGAFRGDTDSGNADLVKGAIFRTAGTGAGSIVEVEFSKMVNLS